MEVDHIPWGLTEWSAILLFLEYSTSIVEPAKGIIEKSLSEWELVNANVRKKNTNRRSC